VHPADQVTFTIGVGQVSASQQDVGLQAIAGNIAVEGLFNMGRDGRPVPVVAESWYIAQDGRSLRIRLRPNVKFHDGTAATSAIIGQIVQSQLPHLLGSAFADVEGIRAVSETEVEIAQKRASPFLVESLDIPIAKPGAADIGTGPFSAVRGPNSIEMTANEAYYQGRPSIQRIVMRGYPTVRAAWADMLRGKVDMLYEVGLDALDSLQGSSKVSIYTFTRSRPYVIVLNMRRPVFRSAEVRRGLNLAIDRPRLIREALYNHGTPADGPVWPHHWAYKQTFPAFQFDPSSAAKSLKGHVAFTCIFPEGALYERLALGVQQALAAVGVKMDVEAVPLTDLSDRVRKRGDFDAVLFDAQLGPNLFRPYQWFHSNGPSNYGAFSSPTVDAALDTIRYAIDDGEYASQVLAFQQAIIEDPPAIFLAWGDRAQAVSRRFEVPVEPGRDVIGGLRLAKLAPEQRTSRN